MGRIRSIKPELPQSQSMGRVSRDARLLFILLWTLADDEGRTRAASRMIASLLFPYDKKAGDLIDGWMEELEREKCIVRYEVEGNAYLEVLNWKLHQKIDRPSKSKFPSRELASPREDSSEDQGSRIKDQGREREALVERVFVSYCASVGKDAKRYTLTTERRKKALLRIDERLSIHEGDLGAVEAELVQAVKNLAASEFHRTKGYTDWTEQIFRSEEEFEKRLNWQKPTEAGNGTNQGNHVRGQQRVDQAIDELRKAGVEISDRRAEESAGEVRAAAWGSDGRDSPGIILEGSG